MGLQPQGTLCPLGPVLSTPALLPTAWSRGRASACLLSCRASVEGLRRASLPQVLSAGCRDAPAIHSLPEAGLRLSGPQPLPVQPTCSWGPPTSATLAGASPYDTAFPSHPLPRPLLCLECPSCTSRRVWFLRPLRLSPDTTSTRQPSLMPPERADSLAPFCYIWAPGGSSLSVGPSTRDPGVLHYLGDVLGTELAQQLGLEPASLDSQPRALYKAGHTWGLGRALLWCPWHSEMRMHDGLSPDCLPIYFLWFCSGSEWAGGQSEWSWWGG